MSDRDACDDYHCINECILTSCSSILFISSMDLREILQKIKTTFRKVYHQKISKSWNRSYKTSKIIKNIPWRNLSIQVLQILHGSTGTESLHNIPSCTLKSEIHPLAVKKGWRKERARDIVFFNQVWTAPERLPVFPANVLGTPLCERETDSAVRARDRFADI